MTFRKEFKYGRLSCWNLALGCLFFGGFGTLSILIGNDHSHVDTYKYIISDKIALWAAGILFLFLAVVGLLNKLLQVLFPVSQSIAIRNDDIEKKCWEVGSILIPQRTKQKFQFSDIVEIYQSVLLIRRGKYLSPREIGYLHIFTENDKMEIMESCMKKEAFAELVDFLKSEVDVPYTLETISDIYKQKRDAFEKAANAPGNWFQRNLFDKL